MGHPGFILPAESGPFTRMKRMKSKIDLAEIKRIREQVMTQDPTRREVYEKNLAISQPIINDLVQMGYPIDALDDLKYTGKSWESAVPVLLRWLPQVSDLHLKETIVRYLSVPWGGNSATAELIEEFKKYAPILPKPLNLWVGKRLRQMTAEEREKAPAQSLAWAIGNALSIVDIKGFEKQIIDLCRNPKYGMARQMIVFGLGRLRDPQAEEATLELLNDQDVKLHAIIALGKMKSKRALVQLEKMLPDKTPGISREARKALTKIMQ